MSLLQATALSGDEEAASSHLVAIVEILETFEEQGLFTEDAQIAGIRELVQAIQEGEE